MDVMGMDMEVAGLASENGYCEREVGGGGGNLSIIILYNICHVAV